MKEQSWIWGNAKESPESSFDWPSYGRGFAVLALAGAILATIGDAGQLWEVNAARSEFGLVVPPDGVIIIGTLTGALGIPLYGFGYLFWRQNLQSRAVAFGGVAYAVPGVIVHATPAFVSPQ